ncbi:MAG: hypothetical protein J6T51_03165 [Kiritimatiellae bacterium]|nr:hypothetical protein [Kiritimatiellia bacterium]
MKRIRFTLAAVAAMFAGQAALADETISADTTLAADRTVDGTLYLKNGATLDLNGHNLTVNGLARPVVEGEDVPGYSFIESVESTGHQWLYSDYTPAGSDRVEMKLELTEVPGSSAWWIFFCSRGAGNVNSFMAGIGGTTKFRVDHRASGTTTGTTYSPGFSKGGVYEISVDGNTGACKVNGSTVLTTTTGAYDTATGPFSILGGHELGAGLVDKQGTAISYIPKCKVYSFKVTDTNNVTKCDMVPAVRISDSAVGMYDRARNMFIENYGTAALIPGYRAVAVTNSSATISSLRVNVGEGVTTTNADVVVSGNVRFVKDGEGTYFAQKAGQSYTAGTVVSNGVVSVKGNGTTALLGAAGGNIVKNSAFDGTGTASGTGNSGNWNYASASGFNLPGWNISNNSCMGLSKASGVWVASGLDVGTYAFYMRTSDTDGKGHTGDITLEQEGLVLTRGRWRVAYDYATRKNATHYPVTNHCNIVKGDVVTEIGFTVAKAAQQTAFASAEWFFDIGEGEEGEYTLQFLQTIADNGSAERTTVLDNIVMEKVAAEVVVESDAKVEFASGARNFSDYRFVMSGGTLLDSSGAGTSALISSMKLLDDSTWENTSNGGFIAPDSGDTLLDLGGKTLSVVSENSQTIYFKNTTITNGTLVLPQHLYINFEGSGVDASTAKIVSENLFRVNAPVVVGDFEERRTTGGGGSMGESGSLAVCGTFKPVTTSYPALTLRDGVTLDLSERSSGISVASPALTFEDNATIAIRLGGNHVSNPLVSWTTAPTNLDTLTFVKAAGESGYSLEVRNNGLYARMGLIIIFQ